MAYRIVIALTVLLLSTGSVARTDIVFDEKTLQYFATCHRVLFYTKEVIYERDQENLDVIEAQLNADLKRNYSSNDRKAMMSKAISESKNMTPTGNPVDTCRDVLSKMRQRIDEEGKLLTGK